jgi:hypothetical protein
MDYTTLSLAEVRAGLESVAEDAEATFGSLDGRQLNWRPDATRWSVAQCFDHLLTANSLMFDALDGASSGTAPSTVWQRLPILPGMFGRLMVRSQAPSTTRRFTAPTKAQPAASAIAADVMHRFAAQQRDGVARIGHTRIDRQHLAVLLE